MPKLPRISGREAVRALQRAGWEAERVVALMARLPEEAGQEVLDFARFLYARRQRSLAGQKAIRKEEVAEYRKDGFQPLSQGESQEH